MSKIKNSIIAFFAGGIAIGVLYWALSLGSWKFGALYGLIGGCLFGIGFTIIQFIGEKWASKKLAQMDYSGKLIMGGGANHWVGKESVGGMMCLTDTSLIYKSHQLNIQNHEMTIDLSDIKESRSRHTINGLLVIMKNGAEEKFVVNNKKKWAKAINKALEERETKE